MTSARCWYSITQHLSTAHPYQEDTWNGVFIEYYSMKMHPWGAFSFNTSPSNQHHMPACPTCDSNTCPNCARLTILIQETLDLVTDIQKTLRWLLSDDDSTAPDAPSEEDTDLDLSDPDE